MKKLAFILVALCLPFLAGAMSQELSLSAWRFSGEDDPSFSAPSFDDSAWEALELPAPLGPREPGRVFWLRARVPSDQVQTLLTAEAGKGLYFLSGKAGFAFDLYANGVYVGSRGSLPPKYELRPTHSAAIHVPDTLVGEGPLLLAIRGAYWGSAPAAPLYRLGGLSAAEFENGPVNFWNGTLFLLLAALSAFLGFYSLTLWAFRPADRTHLLYALMLLCIAFYFYDIGAERMPSLNGVSRALSRASLTLSMAFLVPFMTSFFGLKSKPRTLLLPLGIALAFLGAFLVISQDDSLIGLVFTLSLLPITAFIVTGLALAIAARRRGDPEAPLIILGIGLGLGLSVHDVVYQALGREPFLWLQGIAFFLLNTAVFIALSARQARLKTELERYVREAEANAQTIRDSLSRLEESAHESRSVGLELEAAVASVAQAVEGADEGLRRIESASTAQASSASGAESLVGEFIASLGRVNGRLAEQAAGVEQTAAAATELAAGAKSVAENIGRTAEFAAGLAGLTGEGEKAATALGEAVTRVDEATRGIGEILDALNEFAERTNLLAMNAAIEAAHAGQAGRGFAIIAGEVKGLAQAQSERAGKIRAIVEEIGERVAAGSRDAERVRSALREIARQAAEAAERISEAKAGTAEQERASHEISGAVESLAAAVGAIREESARQSAGSAGVGSALETMRRSADSTRESAVAIAKESAEIVASMRSLRALAAKSLGSAEALSRGAHRSA